MKYVVSADLYIPVLVQVDAKNEDEAELKVMEMDRKYLLYIANAENDAIGINIDGISLDEQNS